MRPDYDQRMPPEPPRATGDGRAVLLAARSDVALHRLLDVLPVFEGDSRISRLFTLIPGSEFGADALTAVTVAGGRTVPWDEACLRTYDLILTASPKGALRLLHGNRVLLPHGAGFGKALASEGTAGLASGLDPAYLRPEDDRFVLHALAHPDQVGLLAEVSPEAAARVRVVGDPTLDRLLASRSQRTHYRRALGTGSRTLVVLASSWGPESLLRRRPDLPAQLIARLPVDTHQLALIVHPNERSSLGAFDLRELLTPALAGGMVLAGAYEEWASLLIAGDVLVTDHGSAALYYSAVSDRPVINAYDGGNEVIPGSPIAELLSSVPRLAGPDDLRSAASGYRQGPGRAAAQAAFAHQHGALPRLREELYDLLGLTLPNLPVRPRVLPPPTAPAPVAEAFDVHVHAEGSVVSVERTVAGLGAAGHHLAAEYGAAGEQFVRTAGVLYRRAGPATPGPYREAWTIAAWTANTLAEYTGCGTAAAVLPEGACVLRHRGDDRLWALHVEPCRQGGKVVHTDPAAVLSAVHAYFATHKTLARTTLTCRIGDHAFPVRISLASPADASLAL